MSFRLTTPELCVWFNQPVDCSTTWCYVMDCHGLRSLNSNNLHGPLAFVPNLQPTRVKTLDHPVKYLIINDMSFTDFGTNGSQSVPLVDVGSASLHWGLSPARKELAHLSAAWTWNMHVTISSCGQTRYVCWNCNEKLCVAWKGRQSSVNVTEGRLKSLFDE